jgi:alkaline phosphatase D
LLNSKATWKFVFTGVPFNRSLIKNDSWVGFKTERKALVDFIKANSIKGVVFISGDVHFGGLDNGKYSSFPEIVVPTPNKKGCGSTSYFGNWSNGAYGAPSDSLPCNGYAKISVFTNPDKIVAEVKDDNGNIRLNMDYSLSQSEKNLLINSPED